MTLTQNDASSNGSESSKGGQKQRVVCVFCGASPGTSTDHLQAARDLAKALHETNTTLVYGGGSVGLMGELARTLVSLSGPQSVHGIIPRALVQYEQDWDPTNPDDVNKAIEKQKYGRTTVVKDMHSRKQMMAREVIQGGPGSGFIALTGGFGTMEELMEVTTWNQLGIHNRGIVMLNINGYWNGLIQWIKSAVSEGFITTPNAGILMEAKTASDALLALQEYKSSEGRYKLEWGSEG